MDDDGPEERIAKHRHAEESEDQPPSGQGKRPPWWRGLLIALLVASPIFGFGAYFLAMYSLGTPTAVTDIICHGRGRGQSCEGTWNIDGQSHTGHIRGPILIHGWPGFRVHGGTAYTDTMALMGLAGVMAAIFVIGSYVRARKQARSGSARRQA
jgi:hypothetical protein